MVKHKPRGPYRVITFTNRREALAFQRHLINLRPAHLSGELRAYFVEDDEAAIRTNATDREIFLADHKLPWSPERDPSNYQGRGLRETAQNKRHAIRRMGRGGLKVRAGGSERRDTGWDNDVTLVNYNVLVDGFVVGYLLSNSSKEALADAKRAHRSAGGSPGTNIQVRAGAKKPLGSRYTSTGWRRDPEAKYRVVYNPDRARSGDDRHWEVWRGDRIDSVHHNKAAAQARIRRQVKNASKRVLHDPETERRIRQNPKSFSNEQLLTITRKHGNYLEPGEDGMFRAALQELRRRKALRNTSVNDPSKRKRTR